MSHGAEWCPKCHRDHLASTDECPEYWLKKAEEQRLTRFGHPVWPEAKCGNCGYVETNTSGGPYDDVFLYKRTCVTCQVSGCDKCLQLTPASDVVKYVKKDGTCYVEGECIKCRGEWREPSTIP